MYKALIRLHNVEQVKDFVSEIESLEGQVSVSVGRIEVMANSIMTLFSLDLSNPLNIVYRNGDDIGEFYKIMEKYMK